jgi:hypothetical protein
MNEYKIPVRKSVGKRLLEKLRRREAYNLKLVRKKGCGARGIFNWFRILFYYVLWY